MKKIFFLSTISAVFLMASCNKDLNQVPISSSTTATFYRSPSDFLQATNAIYADLHNYPVRLANMSEIRSDNIYGVSVTVRDWDPVNDFSPSLAANAYVTEAWGTDFNGIFRANTLLDQVTKNGSYIGSASLA
ncbi:MAG TPA: RagB/SusD family nutrient uptake outer membrane protein, partial [Mucilaginibacter sp.]